MLTCIPQADLCPMRCPDCFFQSGRSYLEPLSQNLPNVPPLAQVLRRPTPVRVNDGHDSSFSWREVQQTCRSFPMKFYNTSCPGGLDKYDAPFVLTVNPGPHTNHEPWLLRDIPSNLMFVRVRTSTWNIADIVDVVVKHYTDREIPVVLTFLAYYTGKIPEHHQGNYIERKRTLNTYQAITTAAWRRVMALYEDNPWVHSCGKIEGEKGSTLCRHCGNCLREYFATLERMEKDGT